MSLKPHVPNLPNIVFVLGGPGCGKGSQCRRIVEDYEFKVLDTGNLLRDECDHNPNSADGKLIQRCMHEGKLAPTDLVLRLIERAIRSIGWQGSSILIDGFPRSFSNLLAWDRALGHKVNVRGCIFLDCSDHIMEERLIEYGKATGKEEDTSLFIIRSRIRTFSDECMPVVHQLERDGLLHRINARQPLEAVWEKVKAVFQHSHALLAAKWKTKPPPKPRDEDGFFGDSFRGTGGFTGTTQEPPGGGKTALQFLPQSSYHTSAECSPWTSTYKQNFQVHPFQRFSVTSAVGFGETNGFSSSFATSPRQPGSQQPTSLRLAGAAMLLGTPRK